MGSLEAKKGQNNIFKVKKKDLLASQICSSPQIVLLQNEAHCAVTARHSVQRVRTTTKED